MDYYFNSILNLGLIISDLLKKNPIYFFFRMISFFKIIIMEIMIINEIMVVIIKVILKVIIKVIIVAIMEVMIINHLLNQLLLIPLLVMDHFNFLKYQVILIEFINSLFKIMFQLLTFHFIILLLNQIFVIAFAQKKSYLII